MGNEYDKAALQGYMDRVGAVGEQMRRRQDESLGLYNSCKQQYDRIYTKLEEIARKAYNRVENAESMRRSAELEYETARRASENAEDEDEDEKNAAAQKMQQAQVMLADADEAYSKAFSAYSRASGDLKRLSDLWNGNSPALESQARRAEDGMASFSRLVDNGNSDLSEYMSIMDKARGTLYGDSGGSMSSNGGPVSSGSTTNAAGPPSSNNNSKQQATVPIFESKLGNTIGLAAAANGLKVISMNIGGEIQTFPGTKSGIAKAHRSAFKSGDTALASFTSKMFSSEALSNDFGTKETGGSINTGVGRFSPFNSGDNRQIAAAMTINGLARQADFGKLDNRTAQDIYNSVTETLEMFPDINLCFVGSLQARNQHIEKSLETMYLDAYHRHYPGASDEDLMPFVRQQVAEAMNELKPGNGTIAQSLFTAGPQTNDEDIIAKFNGISINEKYGSDYNYFIHVRRSDVESKWKPAGCDTPRATVDHELGHQIAALTNAHNDAVIQEMYSDFMRLNMTQRGEALSGYAGKSIHEFIAEGWSEYRNNPHCRTLATNISNRLFVLYAQNTPHLVKVRS